MALTNAQLDAIIDELKTNPNSTGSSYTNLSDEDKQAFNVRFNRTIDNSDLAAPNAYQTLTRIQSYGVPVDTIYLNSAVGSRDQLAATEESNIIVNQNAVDQAFANLPSLNTASSLSKLNVSTSGVLTAAQAANATSAVTSSNGVNSIVVYAPQRPVSDRRARLAPRSAVFNDLIASDGLLAPLRNTYGLMFPITPTITENVDVNYESYDLAHGLMPIQAFRSGGQKTITLDATFVAQTDIEARYCLACIHFIRSFSKNNFGDTDPNAGTPPPVLVFNAYGGAMYKDVPVVIATANFTWPNDVDYVFTTAKSSSTNSAYSVDSMVVDGWVPSKFNINMTLTVQQTPAKMKDFNLESFRKGEWLSRGWI